jgi:peptidoglycan DL-endopeptidase CwlO
VAPFSLPPRTLGAVRRLAGVTAAEPVEAARVKVDGKPAAVLGVNPSAFRDYAAHQTAASDPLWQSVADGAVVASYTMGKLDRLPLGGTVRVTAAKTVRLRVGGFATVGVSGVDAVVSDQVARSLGMPAQNAIVVSASAASLDAVAKAVKRMIPHGAVAVPLMTEVSAGTAGAAAGAAGTTSTGAGAYSGAEGSPVTQAQVTTMLRAALSRRGMPYVWGAVGPASFDCSGLVQWSFAQAGIAMPRVADRQAVAGLAIQVSQLQPGDLLFYHTDPTAPGYISHVAIYLGNGWMIQAPEPGKNVEVVPADTGSEFAGAIRVYTRIAAALATAPTA